MAGHPLVAARLMSKPVQLLALLVTVPDILASGALLEIHLDFDTGAESPSSVPIIISAVVAGRGGEIPFDLLPYFKKSGMAILPQSLVVGWVTPHRTSLK